MALKLAEIIEGGTRLLVPAQSLGTSAPPTAPVFFNPAAAPNRDVAVALAEAAGARSFCDSLSGAGARGVRVATETSHGVEVTLADFNRAALSLGERSARLNRVKGRCEFVEAEARQFLYSRYGRGRRFEMVDVDPFGSPAPYLPAAIAACRDGGIVSATATDAAALCGVYPAASLRRYSAAPLNNEFHHETGVRILANAIRREAAAMEKGASPVAAHSTRHYFRVYVRVFDGARKADEAARHQGYVSVCRDCHEVASSAEPERSCARCGGKARTAGPLWTGPLVDGELARRAEEFSARAGLEAAESILGGLAGVDRFPPWGFHIDEVCSRLKVATVAESRVREILAGKGYPSVRQPFEKAGIKTGAPYSEVAEAVALAAGSPFHPSR